VMALDSILIDSDRPVRMVEHLGVPRSNGRQVILAIGVAPLLLCLASSVWLLVSLLAFPWYRLPYVTPETSVTGDVPNH
jgi:hypothetical protein